MGGRDIEFCFHFQLESRIVSSFDHIIYEIGIVKFSQLLKFWNHSRAVKCQKCENSLIAAGQLLKMYEIICKRINETIENFWNILKIVELICHYVKIVDGSGFFKMMIEFFLEFASNLTMYKIVPKVVEIIWNDLIGNHGSANEFGH